MSEQDQTQPRWMKMQGRSTPYPIEGWMCQDWLFLNGIAVIYIIRFTRTNLVKIGTTKGLHNRLGENYSKHGPFKLLALLYGSYDFEGFLHVKYSHLRTKSGERFQLTDQDIEDLKRDCE